MNLIWLTPEFPINTSNTKGIYIYRTVKELAKYYQIHIICLYPAIPPLLEMVRHLKDWRQIYFDWKKNYVDGTDSLDGLDSEQIIYLRYFRLPRGLFHNLEGYFAYYQAKKILSKIITKNSIIHANWIFPAGTMARIISKKYNVPFITSLLGSDVNRLVYGTKFWKAAKKLLQNANKVTSVSRDLINTCKEKKIEIENSKVEIISNIYETDKFIIKNKKFVRDDLGISDEIKLIFFAGGLVTLKNVDVLISAFSKILSERSDVRLYIAGSGSQKGDLLRLVEKNGIQNQVVFLGTLLTNDLINYYNAADIFCLPSKSEGLPNVLVEALLCGTPVVASNVGGIPALVSEGKNGFLVIPNSVNDLADKLKSSLVFNWDREALRQSVSHHFPDKVIEKYHQIYRNLAYGMQK